MEYARNAVNFKEAALEESDPDSPTLLINRLSCSLVGLEQVIRFVPGTMVSNAYRQDSAHERFQCNFGLNHAFRDRLFRGGLKVSGTDDNGDVRAVELEGHPFYVAVLFLPQTSSSETEPHPLIRAFLHAVRDSGKSEKNV